MVKGREREMENKRGAVLSPSQAVVAVGRTQNLVLDPNHPSGAIYNSTSLSAATNTTFPLPPSFASPNTTSTTIFPPHSIPKALSGGGAEDDPPLPDVEDRKIVNMFNRAIRALLKAGEIQEYVLPTPVNGGGKEEWWIATVHGRAGD
ncbi:hypothetical protein BT69DRAFT_1344906 [Atractiella rhizophila]|nr:hypothetical protein BT69DRAFT_1344906 [Atractiella rhizophila]